MLKIALWILATVAIAIAAIAIADDNFEESSAELACTGHPGRKLENALFTARALSQSGTDPVCTPIDRNDTDSEAPMVSHRHVRQSQDLFGLQETRGSRSGHRW